jgi:hypothetical protein
VVVAVMACPARALLEGTKVRDTLPSELVVTLFCPTIFLPSSVPVGLEKYPVSEDGIGEVVYSSYCEGALGLRGLCGEQHQARCQKRRYYKARMFLFLLSTGPFSLYLIISLYSSPASSTWSIDWIMLICSS